MRQCLWSKRNMWCYEPYINVHMSQRNDWKCIYWVSISSSRYDLFSMSINVCFYFILLFIHSFSCISLLNISVANINPCNPTPCGPNSRCQQSKGQAVCSCLLGYHGTPPTCRPECVVNADCQLKEACNNQRCVNPCIGVCGDAAVCDVINHHPICTCPSSFTGDPFQRCLILGIKYFCIYLSKNH